MFIEGVYGFPGTNGVDLGRERLWLKLKFFSKIHYP